MREGTEAAQLVYLGLHHARVRRVWPTVLLHPRTPGFNSSALEEVVRKADSVDATRDGLGTRANSVKEKGAESAFKVEQARRLGEEEKSLL